VVADSTVQERVPLPTAPATPENVERQIAEVVGALPKGTTWAKLYLPAPAGARAWTGDDVAAYALSQARLLGKIGAPTPAGSVEILGQVVPAEKGNEIITALNLKPVYLVTNPAARAAAAQTPAGVEAQWAQMTPEQRQQYAQAQAAQLASADNATRQGFMQQHMLIMSQLMRQLTPEQRQQMMQGSGAVIRLRESGPA
jgi:hypothetical protein